MTVMTFATIPEISLECLPSNSSSRCSGLEESNNIICSDLADLNLPVTRTNPELLPSFFIKLLHRDRSDAQYSKS